MIKLEDDKLKRDFLLEDLFKLFNNFGNQNNRGLTMVINGKYGSGKTTLLDFIEQKNIVENKFNVIRYNSWENNLFDNPLVPILYTISKLQSGGNKIKEGAKTIIKNLPKVFLGTLANAHSIDLQSFCTNENIFEEYDKYIESIKKFKEVLKNYCEKKKTILLVDELDRCLPEYQIKVLECLYHLLDIQDLIVVIALDKQQLECAIKNKFGEHQNTYGYLAKFIQYEIDLPDGDTYNYIQQLMTFSSDYDYEVKRVISEMFRTIKMSIRECQLIINEINILCNEKTNDGNIKNWKYWYPILLALMIILKRNFSSVYNKYFGNKKDRFEYMSSTEKIPLSESIYFDFIKDIKGLDVESLINYLLSDNYGQCFMLHFINTFLPVRCLEIDSLSKYIKSDIKRTESLINDYSDRIASFPDLINSTINRLSILK